MDVVNKHDVKAHKDRMRSLKEHHARFEEEVDAMGPKPISLKQHPEGSVPKELPGGVMVMGGDYYGEIEGGLVIVVAASDIGENGAWQEV